MDNAPASRRPRSKWLPRFGLRVLLVVVAMVGASCAWVTAQMKIVRDRNAAIDEVVANNGWAGVGRKVGGVRGVLPFWRYWMGDDHVVRLELRYAYLAKVG